MKSFQQRALVAFTLASFIIWNSCASAPTLVPESQINDMGDQAWAAVKKQNPKYNDPETQKFVLDIAKRLVAVSKSKEKKWDVEVFDNKEINAFALPGGHVGVYTGILPVAQNAAALATVIGHEIGHVIAEHANKRVSTDLLSQGALMGAAIALGGNPNSGMIMGALGLGADLGVTLPFSRAQESEADEIGLQLMARAGYEPQEAIPFWQRMKKANQGGEPPALLSTHPATQDRIEHLQKLMPQAVATYNTSRTRSGKGKEIPGIPVASR